MAGDDPVGYLLLATDNRDSAGANIVTEADQEVADMVVEFSVTEAAKSLESAGAELRVLDAGFRPLQDLVPNHPLSAPGFFCAEGECVPLPQYVKLKLPSWDSRRS